METLASFFGISLVQAMSPGPDNIFVLLHSAANGRKAGMLVVLGLCTGILLHTAAVTFGLAALFATSATAFNTLKLLGAGYLVWLAWQSLRAPLQDDSSHRASNLGTLECYARGVLMNLTNPKVALFFLAFLPQFVDADQGNVMLQTLVLGGIFIFATLIVFGAIAYFSGTVGKVLRQSARIQRALNLSAGVIFISLALKLVTAQR